MTAGLQTDIDSVPNGAKQHKGWKKMARRALLFLSAGDSPLALMPHNSPGPPVRGCFVVMTLHVSLLIVDAFDVR